MRELSSKEKAALRGVAQRLKPSLYVGRNGLTDSVVAEMERCLKGEGLVKVGFSAQRDELPVLVEAVERSCDCVCVGGVGKKRSFFREKAENESGDS